MSPGPQAFDELAADYDRQESENAIRRRMRARSLAILESTFATGTTLLDVGCGTGTEAIRLTQLGRNVTAVDASPQMLEVLTQRARAAHLSIPTRQLSAGQLSALEAVKFDGAYSSFGALNTEPDLDAALAALGRVVRPGGRIVLSIMNRWCVSEMLLLGARGRFKDALRRYRPRLTVAVGATTIDVTYPSWPVLRRSLARDFKVQCVEALLLFLVPYAWPALRHRPRLYTTLARVDGWLAPHRPWAWLGDHLLVVAERRGA